MSVDTILVAVRPESISSPRDVAEPVASLACPHDATVVLAQVFGPKEFPRTVKELNHPRTSNVDPSKVAGRTIVIRELIEMFEGADIQVDVEGRVDKQAGDAFARLATETGADHAFVTGGNRTPVGKVALGSVSQHVLLNAPCPVTLIRG